jgi:hypothetical protein
MARRKKCHTVELMLMVTRLKTKRAGKPVLAKMPENSKRKREAKNEPTETQFRGHSSPNPSHEDGWPFWANSTLCGGVETTRTNGGCGCNSSTSSPPKTSKEIIISFEVELVPRFAGPFLFQKNSL